jgi:FdrA protein
MSAEPIVRCAVRPGAYHDSVVLMRLQAGLAALPGILDAGVVMATPANLAILETSGLLAEMAGGAGPSDLLIAVRAESEPAAAEALSRVDALLQLRRAESSEEMRPRSLASALKQLPEAKWVLVSVPGRYAAGVAHEALDLGRNVFLYSDNVPLADEVALKRKARDRGLLVLGPDCGTAILGNTGLGFANRTTPGRIGIVAASGTGLQAAVSFLHARGQGISQAIGLGGRDLSAEVGGLTAAQALDLLRRDPETEVILLISKPPAPEVSRRLITLAHATDKNVVVCFLGTSPSLLRVWDVHFVVGLEDAIESAIRSLGAKRPGMLEHPKNFAPSQRRVRGLFSGGTLALEMFQRLSAVIQPVTSNLASSPDQRLPDLTRSQGHTILDLGADEFTVGRLHPMIDYDLRLRRLRQEAADPEVALILLDIVLGDGAHADPAGELVPVLERLQADARAARRTLDVAALVIGTDLDPQDKKRQVEDLERAGVRVCRSLIDMFDYTLLRLEEIAGGPPRFEDPSVPLDALRGPVATINVGLESFYDSLVAQGASAVQVDWRPPAGGDEKLAGILARMKGR